MDLKTAIEKRSSVRHFTTDPVPPEDLREMVRLAGCAPSVNNSQPWRFVAVTNAALRLRMAQVVRDRLTEILPSDPPDEVERDANEKLLQFCTWFGESPAVIAVETREYEAVLDRALIRAGMSAAEAMRLRGYPNSIAIGASVENLLLAATAMGYGSCWLTGPLVAARALESLIGTEAPWRLAAMVAVGKPVEPTPQSAKQPLEHIFRLIA